MQIENPVLEVSPQTFQADVIERSRQVPVVLLFWAEQVAPAAEMKRVLEQLAGQYQGKIVLALVDVARDQTLAQHLRVQGLPSIRVVRDGQLTDQVDGPQPEQALRAMFDQLTMSSSEMLKEQLDILLEQGEFDTALKLLQQAVQEEPHNHAFRVELADVLVRQGQLADARTVLAGVPEDTAERERPVTRLEMVEEAGSLEAADVLEAQLAKSPEDLETRYRLAVVRAVAGEYEEALEEALEILKRDRTFRDDIGRLMLIRIFALLGRGSELASSYRRRMFNFMH